MIITLCIFLWLLAGFGLTKLFFKVATFINSMSLCVVMLFTLFGPIMLLPVIIEFFDNFTCPHPKFFKRKYK